MSRTAPPREVHVHVSRIVVDRGVVPGTGVAQLREHLAGRIANRVTRAATETTEPASPFSVADAIADAIASRVSPHVDGAGRRS